MGNLFDRSQEEEAKFTQYSVALTFTLLAFAIQSAKPTSSFWRWEIAAWSCLGISGLSGLLLWVGNFTTVGLVAEVEHLVEGTKPLLHIKQEEVTEDIKLQIRTLAEKVKKDMRRIKNSNHTIFVVSAIQLVSFLGGFGCFFYGRVAEFIRVAKLS